MADRMNLYPIDMILTRIIDNKKVQCSVESQGALFNSERTLVQFSLNYDDGYVGHYFLTHRKTPLDKFADLIAHYGLMVSEGKLISKKGMGHVKKFAIYTAKQDLNGRIVDWLDEHVWSHVGPHEFYYTNMVTHEKVFTGPVKAPGAIDIAKLS